MKSVRFIALVPAAALLLTIGCGGNPTPATPPVSAACTTSATPNFAYQLTGFAVSMFTRDSCTGLFTATTPASVSLGYPDPGIESEQMVTDPTGRFAYVANNVSNSNSTLSTVSMYTIDPTSGILSPTAPATVSTGWFPQGIAMDPLGRFVYTANSDGASVSGFTINPTTGVLLPTTPASVSTEIPGSSLSSPGSLTEDPAGHFLYVPSYNSTDASISIFSINQTTGALTPTSPAYVQLFGNPFQIVVSPNGRFLYVINESEEDGVSNAVEQYTVNTTTGIPTFNSTFVATAGIEPTAIAVDSTSHFAYVAARKSNTVTMYTINQTTGQLSLNATTANPTASIAAGSEPFRIDFDPTGKFLYVTNEGNAASVYTVNADGTLTSAGSTGVGNLSLSFANPKS